MDKVKRACKRSLILAFLFSVLCVGGIPLLVVGATRGWWAMLGVGIGFVVLGFYGTPLLWVHYASCRAMYRFVSAVYTEHLYSVQELAQQLAMREKTVRHKLDVCFQKGYFTGFKRDGDRLLPNAALSFEERVLEGMCPNCGGKVVYKMTDPRPVCPYCGSLYKPEDR